MRTIHESIRDYYKGDKLEYDEMIALYSHVTTVTRLLSSMGDKFALARNEANFISETLLGYIKYIDNQKFVEENKS
jgi:hypothetical protein